ncbi:MAG: hypothetical protein ACREUG_03875 [Steroidobacteraceae bacterium]
MIFEDIDDTNERHERRITRCRSCQARINAARDEGLERATA